MSKRKLKRELVLSDATPDAPPCPLCGSPVQAYHLIAEGERPKLVTPCSRAACDGSAQMVAKSAGATLVIDLTKAVAHEVGKRAAVGESAQRGLGL